jgi:hypothetical protein
MSNDEGMTKYEMPDGVVGHSSFAISAGEAAALYARPM